MADLNSQALSAMGLSAGWLWNELSGRNVQREQNEWNRQQVLEAYQRDVDMWRMQNEYNTPSSQMLRYQEAGLNPNLIYSQGNSGNSTSMPHYNPAQGVGRASGLETFQKIASVVGTLVGLKTQIAQADAIAAKTKQVLTTTNYLPEYLQHRNFILGGKANYYWSPQYFDGNGKPVVYNSWQELFNDKPSEFFRQPYFMDYLLKENKLRQSNVTLNYQDALRSEELRKSKLINSLLGKQLNFYNLDKYIGYGTDILGSLLNVANFGLGVGKFNVFKNRMY